MPYNLLFVYKSILQVVIIDILRRDCLVPRLKFITMCDTVHSLKSTYAESFIFGLNRKFLFLECAARKSNIFSRPGHVIYFMFTNVFCKLRLSCAEIEVYHNVRHHTFSEICICGKFYIGICCQEGKYIF
jgi:hypothetical protein